MSLLNATNAAYEDITDDPYMCGIQRDFSPGAWQWKTSDVILMKIFGLTNKSDRMSTKNIFFHGFILYFCGNIRNMKCTVIGQARFHFTCNTFIQKNVLYNIFIYFFLCTIDCSQKILDLFYKTFISWLIVMVKKQLNILTSVAHTMTKILLPNYQINDTVNRF